MFGGVQAVAWTDVKQMFLIVFGLFAAFFVLVAGLPDNVSMVDGLRLAGETGRLTTFDFRFDLTDRYTFWSGTIAALFLFCSYFGTDQSQVQRFLTARSVDEARTSLLMSAYWKIPLQALVLLVGVFMFLFYLFTPGPMLFDPAHDTRVRSSPRAAEYQALEQRFQTASEVRRQSAADLIAATRGGDGSVQPLRKERFQQAEEEVRAIRSEAIRLVRDLAHDATYTDVNYVFPTFILTHLPIGLAGLLIVAILAAAMSTVAAEFAALSTATVIDFYRRWIKSDGDDAHVLRVSRLATGFWGLFAAIVAIYAAELGSLIEVVNRFGSFFYGSILGVFLLAIGWPRANGTGAFVGLIAGMLAVAYVEIQTDVEFLWLNVVGAVAVFGVGAIVSAMVPQASRPQGQRS
jgi:Na+/proline symporter